jgi:RNA polymerase sigma factor (TIGR02999 family)
LANKDITVLLQDWVGGDSASLEKLTPLVYNHLHKIAANVFRSERPDHTLQTTALVHEAFAKLVDVKTDWQDRGHFYALAAKMMRRILVDHAKAKSSAKRGKGRKILPLEDVIVISPQIGDEIIDLHEALNILAKTDPYKSELLELHYFGGLTYQEMSKALNISTSKLDRDIRFAKAWLRNQLES